MTSEPDQLRGFVSATDGTSVLTLVGEVDLATAEVLDQWLTQAETAGPATRLVVDISRLAFLGVAGVNLFLAHRARLIAGGGTLFLRSPSPSARRLLDGVAVDDLLMARRPGFARPVDRHSGGRLRAKMNG